MATATVAIYARVSTYQQEDGPLLDSQIAGCEQIEGPSGGFAEDQLVWYIPGYVGEKERAQKADRKSRKKGGSRFR